MTLKNDMNGDMQIDAMDLAMYFEGCQNVAYACEAHVSRGGTWPYLTIGYGHSGPDVKPGMRISTDQARALLERDLLNAQQRAMNCIKGSFAPHQLGALSCLAMNLRPGVLERSQFVRLMSSGQVGNYDYAAILSDPIGDKLTGALRHWAEFRLCDGKPLWGLVRRRAAEIELFMTGTWSVPTENRIPKASEGASSSNSALFRPGMRDEHVAQLHDALAAAGYPVACGDAYTWVTVEAVKEFQKNHGLTIDGVYGPETAAKLQEVLEARQ